MVVRIGTHMILIVMVYSAVIIVMMKIGTIYQGQAMPDQHVKRFHFYIFYRQY